MKKSTKVRTEIKKIARQVVKAYQPEKIILFGPTPTESQIPTATSIF